MDGGSCSSVGGGRVGTDPQTHIFPFPPPKAITTIHIHTHTYLRDDAKAASQILEAHAPRVYAVDRDGAGLGLHQAEEREEHRGFAGAGAGKGIACVYGWVGGRDVYVGGCVHAWVGKYVSWERVHAHTHTYIDTYTYRPTMPTRSPALISSVRLRSTRGNPGR